MATRNNTPRQRKYLQDVEQKVFPGSEHTLTMKDDVYELSWSNEVVAKKGKG